jgi:DNA-binding NtrC family response regulator
MTTAPVDLTRDLQDLVGLAAREDGVEDLFRRGLDWLQRAPYDLATIFALEGAKLVARAARGQDHEHAKILEAERLGEAGVLETSRSAAVREVARRARQVAETDTPVPGNIRELANVLERATILSPKRELGPAVLDLPSRADVDRDRASPRVTGSAARVGTLDEVQRAHIERVLALTGGRLYGKGGAAERLGLKPSTLQSRMKKLGVRRPA